MAIPFLSALAKTLQRWRRRPLETKPRLDHRNLALESLEERVNPANFNIDLAGYSGTLQVTSINTGSSDLTITQAGTDILAFSSATSIGDMPLHTAGKLSVARENACGAVRATLDKQAAAALMLCAYWLSFELASAEFSSRSGTRSVWFCAAARCNALSPHLK